MSDSGEGLVDAEARLQEQIDAREEERKRRGMPAVKDPEKMRERESLRLAMAQLEQQLGATQNETRRRQIELALKDLKKRIDAA
jgi:hypothetical protein